jgi:hypothetical protein
MNIPEFSVKQAIKDQIILPDSGFAKVSDYKKLMFILRCDDVASLIFHWSSDGVGVDLEQKLPIKPKESRLIAIEVITDYLSIEVLLSVPGESKIYLTTRGVLLSKPTPVGSLLPSLSSQSLAPLLPSPSAPAPASILPLVPQPSLQSPPLPIAPVIPDAIVPPPVEPQMVSSPDVPAPSSVSSDHVDSSQPSVYLVPAEEPAPKSRSFVDKIRGIKKSSPTTPVRDDRLPGLILKGGLFLGDAASIKMLAPGAEGEVLTMVGGMPVWK